MPTRATTRLVLKLFLWTFITGTSLETASLKVISSTLFLPTDFSITAKIVCGLITHDTQTIDILKHLSGQPLYGDCVKISY
jgi:hypothetical protein